MKKNKKKNIPELRFPEFKDAGEWEEKTLGEVGEIRGGGVDKKIREGEEKVMLLNYMDVYKNNFITSSDLKQQTSATREQKKKCEIKKGDVFFTPTSEVPDDIAQSAVAIEDISNGVYSYHLVRFRLNENWDLKFRTYVFKTESFFNTVSKLAQGSGTRYVITLPVFRSLKVLVPSLPEQQKIAELLSSLDEHIEAEIEILKNLKQHKKGLLQKLFPQEGKKIPELRFPEFKNAGEWEEKTLGEVGEIITGSTPFTKNIEYYKDGLFPWVTPSDIEDKKYIYTTKKQLSEKGLKKGRFVPKNSLLVTCIASIGKNAILKKDGSCNQQINAINPFKNYDVDFLYYLMEKNVNVLVENAGQGGMLMLNKTDFSNLKFEFPSLPEQQKIAAALSGLDEHIEAQAEKIEALKKHKKGLMQKVFPNDE